MVRKVMRGGCWVLGVMMAAGLVRAADVDVDHAYTIRLEKFDLPSSLGQGSRYGIYLSLGGSDSPRVFEFDTGGEGLYAAYSADAEWWGPNVTTETTPINKNFGSGLEYTGTVAQTSLTFYDAVSKARVLATPTATPYSVGQSTNIVDTKTSETYWPPQVVAEAPSPPVYETFYGDFGLSLKKGDHGIENIFAQLTYGGSVTAGYTVSLGGKDSPPSIQVGLKASDLTNPNTIWFTMPEDGNKSSDTSPTYYAAELITATLSLSGSQGDPLPLSNIGLNLDTGNGSPGILYKSGSKEEGDLQPVSNLYPDGSLESLESGLTLTLVATDANGVSVTLDQFVTGTDYGTNFVWEEARSDGGDTYMNIGQLLFEKYAVTYDLKNGQLGLTPYAVPEPGAASLLLLGVAAALAVWRRGRIHAETGR